MKTEIEFPGFLSLLMLLWFTGPLPAQNSSRTILNVPSSYGSIQSAINAAGIGDTVLVAPGMYFENINFYGKSLMVASQYLLSGDTTHILQTVIDGGNNGAVATFETNENANALLVGFTLRNGNSAYGGGVRCVSADPVLSNLVIKNCSAGSGAGIYLYESDAYIWRVAFVNNQAGEYGGGLCGDYYAYPAVYNVRFVANSAEFGGAFYCYNSAPYLGWFEMQNNQAEFGAGIYLYGSSPNIWEGNINGNTAESYGGGILCDYYSEPWLSYLTVTGNTADYGAGLHLSYSNASLFNLSLVANEAAVDGGGVYCYYASPMITNSIISFNQGPYGIYVYDGNPEITYSNFYGNEIADLYNVNDEIGVNVQKNLNADSCDIYYNLKRNPGFVDLPAGDIHLSAGSDCIDAGNPSFPEDPDQSTADMGRFFHAQTFVAAFSADPAVGLPPLTVNFTNESTGNPTHWEWDFNNDGVIDSENPNPQWTYTEMGSYSVRLKISTTFSSDIRIKPDLIRVDFIEKPAITAITDVPEDQGGWVEIGFLRSVFDTDTLQKRTTETYTVEYNTGTGWVAANSCAAYGAGQYNILCHTPFDSTAITTGLIDFRIIAAMDEGNFASDVVQGYSVDNLVPGMPSGLLTEVGDSTYSISWTAVAAPDLQYYALYLGDRYGNFGADPWKLTAENTLAGLPLPLQAKTLAVAAIDFSGNQSSLSASVDAPMLIQQKLTNGWSDLSAWTDPANPDIGTMFAPLAGKLEFLIGADGFWHPASGQNTLKTWDATCGYLIKVSDTATVAITGYYRNDKCIDLRKGWNLVPVLSECAVSAGSLQQLLGGALAVIREGIGTKVYWPSHNINQLKKLQPGRAYWIFMQANGQFCFPECTQ